MVETRGLEPVTPALPKAADFESRVPHPTPKSGGHSKGRNPFIFIFIFSVIFVFMFFFMLSL